MENKSVTETGAENSATQLINSLEMAISARNAIITTLRKAGLAQYKSYGFVPNDPHIRDSRWDTYLAADSMFRKFLDEAEEAGIIKTLSGDSFVYLKEGQK